MTTINEISLYDVCGKETAKKYIHQKFDLTEDVCDVIDNVIDFAADQIDIDKYEILNSILGNIDWLGMSPKEIERIAESI